MKLKLYNSHVLIGAKSTTEQAINLPLVAPEESAFTANGIQYVSYFCTLKDNNSGTHTSSNDKASRCINLVKQLLLQVEQEHGARSVSTPIFWLLPEFIDPFVSSSDVTKAPIDNPNTFENFAQQLQSAIPSLFNHPQSQLFPFGRASFPIALAAAKTLFDKVNTEQHTVDTITLISVDSLWHDIPKLISDNALVTAKSEQGIIPSEGAIFAQISQADEGVSADLIQNSMAPSKQRDTIVKELFNKSVDFLAQINEQQTTPAIFSHLYLPGNGDDTLQKSWLDAYYQLSGYVDETTSICQTALFTGELGCVTGLYNFLHIVNSYKNDYLQGNVLQLEVSDSLHQSVVLYSWDKP